MNAARRMVTEYSALNRILGKREMAALIAASVANCPEILKSRKLTAVDKSMSRNLTIHFESHQISLPIAEVDAVLAARKDNPTFGNVREIYARNCYLRHLRAKKPFRSVLDLGANRGVFTLFALMVLDAEIAIGVEPISEYDSAFKLLLKANHCDGKRTPRYGKFVSSPAVERENPTECVSIQSILQEQGLEKFNLVKMDIEGNEWIVFSEPEWLSQVDNLCMELHPHTGDQSLISRALDQYGFKYIVTDQHGNAASGKDATFLYASSTGELAA